MPFQEYFTVNWVTNDWTNDDYNKAKQIWKHFDIKNMVFLLKKRMFHHWLMFLKFRDVRWNHYGLDPFFTYTLPKFVCDALLKFTGVEQI